MFIYLYILKNKTMSNPKDKAQQLIYAFEAFTDRDNELEFAKQCAAITIDEMISQMLSLMKVFNEDRSEFEAIELDYLTKVKQEIENYDSKK